MQGRVFIGGGKFSCDDHGLKLFRKSAKALGQARGFAVGRNAV
jgi:hypothetical protein